MITEKELSEVGKGQYLEFLRLLMALISTSSSIVEFPPYPLEIPKSITSTIKGLKLKKTIDFLFKDFVLDRIKIDHTQGGKIEYIPYLDTEKWEASYNHATSDEKDKHYPPYYLVMCIMDVWQLDRYIEEIRAIGESTPMKVVSRDASHNTEKLGRLIHKDAYGDFSYNGRRIEMSHGTIYYKVFDMLYEQADQTGFLSYEKIEKYLVDSGMDGIEDVDARNKRIRNAMGKLGLFKSTKVGDSLLKNETLDGRKLIEPVAGNGWKLNNPKI